MNRSCSRGSEACQKRNRDIAGSDGLYGTCLPFGDAGGERVFCLWFLLLRLPCVCVVVGGGGRVYTSVPSVYLLW